MSTNEEIIQKILSGGDPLANTLSASPFEIEDAPIIDADFFYSEFSRFYVELNSYTETIFSHLKDPKCDVVVIHGFSGTGKTSFINHLIRDKSESFGFCNIDCGGVNPNDSSLSEFDETDLKRIERLIVQAIDREEIDHWKNHYSKVAKDINEKNFRNAITTIIRECLTAIDFQNNFYRGKQLKIYEAYIISFLYDFVSKRLLLGSFIEKTLRETLSNLEKKIKDGIALTFDDWVSLLDGLEINDTFLILILYLAFIFSDCCFSQERQSKIVITLDNLDALPDLLLYEQLEEKMLNSLNHWKQISPKLFPNISFRLILSVRDSNSSAINAHKNDHFTVIKEPYVVDKDFHINIINRRLEFYKKEILKEIGRDNEQEHKIISILQKFIINEFYSNLLVPSFNFDYRKMIPSLYHSIREFLNNAPESLFDSQGGIDDKFLTGFEGAILYDIFASLKLERFFEKLLRIQPNEGYCLISRMLLSLIINKSGIYDISNLDDKNWLKILERANIKLSSIIEDAERFYSHEEILDSITSLAMGEGNFPYLVGFTSRKVNKDWYRSYFKIEYDGLGGTKKIDQSKIEKDEIKITPAGIVFLKDFIIHYELYSRLSIRKKDKDGNYKEESNMALFNYSWETQGFSGDLESLFFIKRTLDLVEKHNTWMLKFYNKWSLNNIDYLNSNFSYQFDHEGKPSKSGYFHMMRIAISHIEYIDNLRRMVLNHKYTNTVNKKFLDYIKNYIDLAEKWKNSAESQKYIERVKDNIKKIENSDYKLFNIEICSQ